MVKAEVGEPALRDTVGGGARRAWQPVSGTDRKRFREGDKLRPEKSLGHKELSADGVSGVVVSVLSLGMFHE